MTDHPPFADARRAAALLLADCQQALARSGDSVLTALLDGQTFEEWAHYPADDARDPTTGARFYYHAHAADQRAPGEHGHFHCFVQIDGAAAPTHLAALSVDAYGRPTRLFAPNRWVTAEDWRPAAETAALLDRFVVDVVRPNWAVNRWVSALAAFYRPEIAALLDARDAALAARGGPSAALLDDRSLEVLAERPLDYETDLGAALHGAPAAPAR